MQLRDVDAEALVCRLAHLPLWIEEDRGDRRQDLSRDVHWLVVLLRRREGEKSGAASGREGVLQRTSAGWDEHFVPRARVDVRGNLAQTDAAVTCGAHAAVT